MKVRVSAKARADLLHIYGYLAEHNPTAAESILRDIDAKLRQLSHFPFMGRERPEFARTCAARWFTLNLIFYTVVHDHLVVVRVVDGRMDLDKELQR
jgi:plasmid stabilization system protein ParE